MNEDDVVEEQEEGPILKEKKPRKKMEKKPRSEAQIASFQAAIAKKKERDVRLREVKELAAAELILSVKKKREETTAPKSKPAPSDEDDEEEEEEEIVVVKKKKDKKKRRVEIELTSSDESDNDSRHAQPATRKLTSQQNKRSVIKVHTNSQQQHVKKAPLLNLFSD